nr:MAG TPA: hypothetical protein [Caudoviricetes sp.]
MERLTERYVPNNEKKGIAGIKVFESENKTPLVKVLSGEYLYPAIEKLADYEELEERLHKIFGEESTFSLADVIDALEMKLSEPDKKHPVNARILTYEEANKWQEYKDLEEQGLLVRLPCKEAYSKSGDFVYLIYDYEIVECVHCGLGIDPLSGRVYITLAADEKIFPYRNPDPEQDLDPTDWCTNVTDAEASELGKTVFFTREEVEKKLKEMNKNG